MKKHKYQTVSTPKIDLMPGNPWTWGGVASTHQEPREPKTLARGQRSYRMSFGSTVGVTPTDELVQQFPENENSDKTWTNALSKRVKRDVWRSDNKIDQETNELIKKFAMQEINSPNAMELRAEKKNYLQNRLAVVSAENLRNLNGTELIEPGAKIIFDSNQLRYRSMLGKIVALRPDLRKEYKDLIPESTLTANAKDPVTETHKEKVQKALCVALSVAISGLMLANYARNRVKDRS